MTMNDRRDDNSLLGWVLLAAMLLAAVCVCARAEGQTTRPLVGVYAQVTENMDKWDAVADVYVGWSSYKNTHGRDHASDRAEQLRWRKNVAARGKKYADSPTTDWRWQPPTPADVKAMVDDPACIGVLFMDEPDQYIKNPVTGKWDTFRVSVETYKAFAAAIDAGDPDRKLRRIGSFTGQGITPQNGVNLPKYAPYFDCLTDISNAWYPKNVDAARHLNTYPALTVSLTKRAAPTKRHWAIVECSWQNVSSVGGSPSGDDIRAQAKALLEGGVDALIYFPQKIGGGYVADNTTAEQFQAIKDVVASLPSPTTKPAPTVPTPTDNEVLLKLVTASDSIAVRMALLEAAQMKANEQTAARLKALEDAVKAPRVGTITIPAPATQPAN